VKNNLEHQQLEIGLRRTIGDRVTVVDSDFSTQTPPDNPETLSQMGINYIDNSDKDFSTDAYENDPAVGGDEAKECFNFYRQRFIRLTDAVLTASSTTLSSASAPFKSSYTYPMPFFALGAGTDEKALVGTITRVSDTSATMSVSAVFSVTDGIVFFGDAFAQSAATALKTSGHTSYAANEGANTSIARWDNAAGQTEIGGNGTDNFDIAAALPFNLATRGLDLFFSLNVKLRSGATADNQIVVYVGIYDTTSGNQKFLEADNFDLTVNYIGTAGATQYECVVVGTFSNGEQVISDVVTVSGAASVFDADNYLDWDWQNAPRILDFALYRRNTGTGETVRVYTIYNGETRFFDKDVEGSASVAGLPDIAARREYAYAESAPFTPTTDYRRVPILFRVPPTYAQSATTGRQILRIGIYNDAGNDVRPVVIDRVMLSLTESVWNRSARDLERIRNLAPTAGTPDGNQGIGCFTDWNPIIIKERPNEDWRSIPIEQAKKGMFIYSGGLSDRITDVKISVSNKTYFVELSNGIEIECTASERFITSSSDRHGTRFDRLGLGSEIQSSIDGVNYQARIVKITPKTHKLPIKIYTLSLQNGKIFVVGRYNPTFLRNPLQKLKLLYRKLLKRPTLAGAKAHNRKEFDYNAAE